MEEDEYSYYTYSESEYEGKEKKTVEVEKPRGREQSSDETVMTEQDREKSVVYTVSPTSGFQV